MGCGIGMIKYLLFIFNLVFSLCGLAILVVGVIVHLQFTQYVDHITSVIKYPSVTLIVIGSIIFIIAFFGCCGAIRESHCMTVTFASLLLVILIAQVAIAIFAFVSLKNNPDLKTDIREEYANKVFKLYGSQADSTEIVDDLQLALGCCGIDSFEDYQSILKQETPWSCCGNPKPDSCLDWRVKDKPGCAIKLEEVLIYAGTTLGGIALGIAAVELIGIIFALCLANSIKNDERRGYRV